MKGVRDIKTRIRATKSTSQITKAMQLIAAFKMKRAQHMLIANRPYALLFAEILSSVLTNLEDQKVQHVLIGERPVRMRGILILSTDRGLCGALNANLFRILQKVEGPAQFVTVGKKSVQYLTRNERSVLADFHVTDGTTFAEVRLIADYMLDLYIAGKIDTIEVLYTHFVNTLKQDTCLDRLAPIVNIETVLQQLKQRIKKEAPQDALIDNRAMLFEPDPKTILDYLTPLFIKYEIYERLLEARASEHSARMVAMKSATDNAKKLLDALSLEYNKARQASITQEIVEIAGASLNQT